VKVKILIAKRFGVYFASFKADGTTYFGGGAPTQAQAVAVAANYAIGRGATELCIETKQSDEGV
jgi:hypothetical protein